MGFVPDHAREMHRGSVMGHKLAFVMDPLEAVNIETDTTFALMLAAQERGHQPYYVDPDELELDGDRLFLRAWPATLRAEQGRHARLSPQVRLPAAECGAIFLRTDPPVDSAYLESTWLLSFAEREGVPVVNSPAGVREANEKLYALRFPALCPPTVVSSSSATLRDFLTAQGGEAVVKPLDGHGGLGVLRLRQDDSNVTALLELLTHEGRRPVLLQRFLPEGARGDKRLHVIDGELRGVVRRLSRPGDHRGNVHAGGSVEACDATDAELAIVATLRDSLRADGLLFVGLDVIAGKLIEVNVTSPTLVQELRRLGGPDLAHELLEAVEGRIAARPAGPGFLTPSATLLS